jgi:NhaP-type Na+/H+ and K+/H+ antiporter
MKNKKAEIDFMIYNIKKDEWTWISKIKSGEFMYKNTLVKVFTSQTNVRFFQTIWGNTTCQVRNWETCMDTIEDRTKNAQHYAFMEKMSQDSVAEMIESEEIVQKMIKDKKIFDKK